MPLKSHPCCRSAFYCDLDDIIRFWRYFPQQHVCTKKDQKCLIYRTQASGTPPNATCLILAEASAVIIVSTHHHHTQLTFV